MLLVTSPGVALEAYEPLVRELRAEGAAVTPGKPDASLLVKLIEHSEEPHMPAEGAALSRRERQPARTCSAANGRAPQQARALRLQGLRRLRGQEGLRRLPERGEGQGRDR